MQLGVLRAAMVCGLAAVLAAVSPAARAAQPSKATQSAEVRVVVSLKPLHAIAAAVMEGAGEPDLLLPGAAATPHGYSLRPSQMRALSRADLVFWVGPELETFLEGPLAGLPEAVRVASALDMLRALIDAGTGGRRRPEAAPALWTARAPDGWEQSQRYTSPGQSVDPHIWLDPVNAAALAEALAAVIGKTDPPRAELYRTNASRFRKAMTALRRRIDTRLVPVRGRPFIVYHDSYQYLERRFGLRAVGAVTRGAHVNPGAAHLRKLRRLLESGGAVCVFVEPQFSPRLAETLVRGTEARMRTLDPLGGSLAAGPDAYGRLMENLSGALARCLKRDRTGAP